MKIWKKVEFKGQKLNRENDRYRSNQGIIPETNKSRKRDKSMSKVFTEM